MNKTSQYKKIVVLFLLPALCWLFFNSVYYRHLHKLSSGIVINHAHPYNKKADNRGNSPFASHEHTKNEIILYDVISHSTSFLIVCAFVALRMPDLLLKKIKIPLKKNLYKQDLFVLQKYRAPPSFF